MREHNATKQLILLNRRQRNSKRWLLGDSVTLEIKRGKHHTIIPKIQSYVADRKKLTRQKI